MTQLGQSALVQPAFLAVALHPGPLLPVNIGSLAAISLGMPLGQQRLTTALIQLTGPHPGHVVRLGLRQHGHNGTGTPGTITILISMQISISNTISNTVHSNLAALSG